MSNARSRREAYAWVAEAIDSALLRDRLHGYMPEVERIRDAMRAASEVVDGEGVGRPLAAPDSNERGGGGP